ncbi:MAG: hypothetical protein ACOYOK_06160, partial [Pseudobdellovibrionaceae bacterium]
MMLNLVSVLKKYRFYVSIFLLLPLPLILMLGNLSFSLLPKDPFPQFQVVLNAPGVQAEELVQRVTEHSEKIFNGLPAL